MITVLLACSTALGVLGFALVNLNVSLASLLNAGVGTLATAGLFGLLTWDLSRTFTAEKTAARFAHRHNASTGRIKCVSLRRDAALAGC